MLSSGKTVPHAHHACTSDIHSHCRGTCVPDPISNQHFSTICAVLNLIYIDKWSYFLRSRFSTEHNLSLKREVEWHTIHICEAVILVYQTIVYEFTRSWITFEHGILDASGISNVCIDKGATTSQYPRNGVTGSQLQTPSLFKANSSPGLIDCLKPMIGF